VTDHEKYLSGGKGAAVFTSGSVSRPTKRKETHRHTQTKTDTHRHIDTQAHTPRRTPAVAEKKRSQRCTQVKVTAFASNTHNNAAHATQNAD
jgi:hypothetical protein